MTQQILHQLLKQADQLSPSERLWLASRLIQDVRKEMPAGKTLYKWKDAHGLLDYPALGEDAQTYIHRSRTENDSHRAHLIRDGE